MVITLQGNMCDESCRNLLIDLNSPLQGRLDKAELKPLVPSVNTNDIDEPHNNPFDFVDHQTNLNVRMLNDPFELAYYLSDGNDKESELTEVNLQDSVSALESADDRTENSFILIEDVTDPCIEVCVSFSDISPGKLSSRAEKKIETEFKKHKEEGESNTDLKPEVSLTEASDEAIKAIVANRVNACIQNALNQSKLCAFNQDSSIEHVVRNNTSSPLQKHSKREINISTRESLHHMYEDPFLKSNWNTPQSCFKSWRELNRASRYSYSSAIQENMSSSMCEITSPCYKMLECVGNFELRRNNSCFGALSSSETDYGDLLTNRISEELVRNSISDTCTESSSGLLYKNKKLQEKGDDSVFLEANNVAFMLRSFTQSSSDGEEDILTCKPQWEKSILKLPKFSSEENGTEFLKRISDYKLSISEEKTVKNYISTNQNNNKLINKCDKEAVTPPDIVLPVVLPVVEKTRIKSKQMQQTAGKRGPIKAVVPLGNMVRFAGIESKVSPPNGNKDDGEDSSQPQMSVSGKSMESKSNKGSLLSETRVGIPLVSPAVSLKNKESYFGKDSVQSKISKSSQFNLSGLVATSTPARKIPCSVTSRNSMKLMPSPIPVEMTKTKNREVVLKNRSFDGDQRQVKNKELPNRIHSRSKSASANSKQISQPKSYNYAKKICIPADKSSSRIKTRPEVRNAYSDILKPLKLNGQQDLEVDHLLLDKKKLTTQLFPKLKKNSLLEIDKENVKPL